jgi:fumarate hydratase class II
LTEKPKSAANANHADQHLDDERHSLIVRVRDEILGGQHQEICFRCMFG